MDKQSGQRGNALTKLPARELRPDRKDDIPGIA